MQPMRMIPGRLFKTPESRLAWNPAIVQNQANRCKLKS